MKGYYLNICNKDYHELLKQIINDLKTNNKDFIITANSEIFMAGINNKQIDKFLKDKNNIVLADGISIIKTSKYFNLNLKQKIAGVELCESLLNYANDNDIKTYIYGSKQDTLNHLKIKYPSINYVGLKNGYDNDKEEIKKDIIKKKPDLIIIALGVPAQEIFIDDIINDTEKGVFIGVGGSLDVISGCKKRAPKIFIKLNLEWLYRILKEPKRIKRFWNNNIKLFFVTKKEAKKEVKK